MKRILTIFALLICTTTVVYAADYDVDVSVSKNSLNWSYTLNVTNNSNLLSVTDWTVRIAGGGNIDHVREQDVTPMFSTNPDLGVNNDTLDSGTVQFLPVLALAPGDTFTKRGDMDGTIGGFTVDVTFSDGQTRSIALLFDGNNVYSGSVAENVPAPPTTVFPIVNGQGAFTLTWSGPTERVDGTPIAPGELDGFVVYWGDRSGLGRCASEPANLADQCYQFSAQISPVDTQHANIIQLAADTVVYFTLVAYDIDADGNTLISQYATEQAISYEGGATPPPVVVLPPNSPEFVINP